MINRLVIWLAESALHQVVSGSILVIRYRGRSSGKSVALPVNYVITDQSEGQRLWITSARDRVWWRNFKGGYKADLILRGERRTRELFTLVEQPDVLRGLKEYLVAAPNAARYFGIHIDEAGQFEERELRRAADQRVMIYTDL